LLQIKDARPGTRLGWHQAQYGEHPVSENHPGQHALAQRLLPLLDLTSLGEDDTPAQIEALCASARTRWGSPAAICVYPEHVSTVSRALRGTAIAIASVVNFPDGGEDSGRVSRETRRALAAGANEIDLVFPYRAFLRGDEAVAERVVAACRDACGENVRLKLILETGVLVEAGAIRAASRLGIALGVDFLKTSTGKVPINATPEAATVMLDAIAEAGGRCGFKAAGGIRRIDDASGYLEIARSRLGDDWIHPAHFRIGASTLFTALHDTLALPA
jgi:deoxyribose-phosphate aldolase